MVHKTQMTLECVWILINRFSKNGNQKWSQHILFDRHMIREIIQYICLFFSPTQYWKVRHEIKCMYIHPFTNQLWAAHTHTRQIGIYHLSSHIKSNQDQVTLNKPLLIDPQKTIPLLKAQPLQIVISATTRYAFVLVTKYYHLTLRERILDNVHHNLCLFKVALLVFDRDNYEFIRIDTVVENKLGPTMIQKGHFVHETNGLLAICDQAQRIAISMKGSFELFIRDYNGSALQTVFLNSPPVSLAWNTLGTSLFVQPSTQLFLEIFHGKTNEKGIFQLATEKCGISDSMVLKMFGITPYGFYIRSFSQLQVISHYQNQRDTCYRLPNFYYKGIRSAQQIIPFPCQPEWLVELGTDNRLLILHHLKPCL